MLCIAGSAPSVQFTRGRQSPGMCTPPTSVRATNWQQRGEGRHPLRWPHPPLLPCSWLPSPVPTRRLASQQPFAVSGHIPAGQLDGLLRFAQVTVKIWAWALTGLGKEWWVVVVRQAHPCPARMGCGAGRGIRCADVFHSQRGATHALHGTSFVIHGRWGTGFDGLGSVANH